MDNVDKRLISGRPKPYLSGSYRWLERIPEAGSSYSQTTAGGQVIQVALNTTDAWSPSGEWLEMTCTPAASGSGEYNWIYSHIAPFHSIDCFDSATGARWFRLDGSFNFYMDMVTQFASPFSEYLQRSKGTPGGVDAFTEFPCPSRLIGSAGTVGARPNNTLTSYPYLERLYMSIGGSNTATPILKYRWMLKNIPHSIWSTKLDIPMPNQTYIRFTFAPSSQFAWFGDSATDATANATEYAGSIAWSGVKYYQCVNTNEAVGNALRAQMMSGSGMEVFAPVVEATYKNVSTSTSVTNTVRANAALGKRLQRIYTSVYSGVNTINDVYNKSNLADAKISSFYSQLNSQRLQNNNLVCANQDEYSLYRQQVSDSGNAILDINSYKFNFVWCDIFDGTPINDMNVYDGGLPLSSEQTYDINFVTVSASYNVYSFAVYLQRFVITKTGLFIQ